MPIKGGDTQFKNTTLILSLPLINRNITTTTITVGSAAAVGATSISLTAGAAATKIVAGTSLSFVAPTSPVDRQQVLIVDDATLGTTPTSVNCFPLTKAIAASSTTVWYPGSLPLLGIQDFSVASQDQEVDTTNTLSGFGTEMSLVRSGKTMTISGIQIPADECLERVVKSVLLQGANFGKEVRAELTLPDGEMYRGIAKLRNWQAAGNQNEVKKYSFELTFMGVTFEQIPAYLTFN